MNTLSFFFFQLIFFYRFETTAIFHWTARGSNLLSSVWESKHLNVYSNRSQWAPAAVPGDGLTIFGFQEDKQSDKKKGKKRDTVQNATDLSDDLRPPFNRFLFQGCVHL